jgi:N-acyl-phosphatidylethanolamine-hydrolysing phospholipase D
MRALAAVTTFWAVTSLWALTTIGCASVHRYPESPQWRGERFAYPDAWPPRPGIPEFLKWTFGGRPSPTRDFRAPYVENDGAKLRQNRERASVTWIGHATTLVQAGGVSVLTDPIFSEDIGLLFWRKAPPGVALAKLPPIDAVVISHSHRDHLDEDSVRALGPSVLFIVPLGLADWFRARGLSRVIELDWWQSIDVNGANGARARVTMVPAQHWSQRGIADFNRSL